MRAVIYDAFGAPPEVRDQAAADYETMGEVAFRRRLEDADPGVRRLALIELADGVTLDEVKAKTEAEFRVALKNA